MPEWPHQSAMLSSDSISVSASISQSMPASCCQPINRSKVDKICNVNPNENASGGGVSYPRLEDVEHELSRLSLIDGGPVNGAVTIQTCPNGLNSTSDSGVVEGVHSGDTGYRRNDITPPHGPNSSHLSFDHVPYSDRIVGRQGSTEPGSSMASTLVELFSSPESSASNDSPYKNGDAVNDGMSTSYSRRTSGRRLLHDDAVWQDVIGGGRLTSDSRCDIFQKINNMLGETSGVAKSDLDQFGYEPMDLLSRDMCVQMATTAASTAGENKNALVDTTTLGDKALGSATSLSSNVVPKFSAPDLHNYWRLPLTGQHAADVQVPWDMVEQQKASCTPSTIGSISPDSDSGYHVQSMSNDDSISLVANVSSCSSSTVSAVQEDGHCSYGRHAPIATPSDSIDRYELRDTRGKPPQHTGSRYESPFVDSFLLSGQTRDVNHDRLCGNPLNRFHSASQWNLRLNDNACMENRHLDIFATPGRQFGHQDNLRPLRILNEDRSLLADTRGVDAQDTLNSLTSQGQSPTQSCSQLERAARVYRQGTTMYDASCTWSGLLPTRTIRNAVLSCKVFLGGVPWDITEYALISAFRPFGPVRIEWPGKDAAAVPKGYLYVIFESERHVKALLNVCTQDYTDGSSWYYNVTSRRMRNKEVQVIPWIVSDSNHVRCQSQRLDPQRTVFVGALHGMLTAEGLSNIFNDLFSGVIYAGIDTDKYKYPIGSGRVTFNNARSYMKAVSAAFIEIKTPKFMKKVQVDPYLEDALCSLCNLKQGPYFCRDLSCFKYFCRNCWEAQHAVYSQISHHRPLMRNTKAVSAALSNSSLGQMSPSLSPHAALLNRALGSRLSRNVAIGSDLASSGCDTPSAGVYSQWPHRSADIVGESPTNTNIGCEPNCRFVDPDRSDGYNIIKQWPISHFGTQSRPESTADQLATIPNTTNMLRLSDQLDTVLATKPNELPEQ